MIWPWQYRKKVKEYEARIAELKLAGWAAVCGWSASYGKLNYEDYKEIEKNYDWFRECAVFAKDKPIDGPRPNYTAYRKMEASHE